MRRTRTRGRTDPERRGAAFLAIFFAIVTALAVWSHLAGNPTATNGIVGAGFWSLMFTGFWLLFRHDDRKWKRDHQRRLSADALKAAAVRDAALEAESRLADSDPTLRELLAFCFTAPAYSLLPWQVERLVDVAESAVSELLTSDATVERVARALYEHDGGEADPILGIGYTRERYRNTARAALAAAMAGDEEADRASS